MIIPFPISDESARLVRSMPDEDVGKAFNAIADFGEAYATLSNSGKEFLKMFAECFYRYVDEANEQEED